MLECSKWRPLFIIRASSWEQSCTIWWLFKFEFRANTTGPNEGLAFGYVATIRSNKGSSSRSCNHTTDSDGRNLCRVRDSLASAADAGTILVDNCLDARSMTDIHSCCNGGQGTRAHRTDIAFVMFNFMRGLQQQVLKVKASNSEQSNAQLTSRVQCIYSTCTKSSHRTDPALWTNDVPVLGSTAFLAVMQITKSAKGTGGC